MHRSLGFIALAASLTAACAQTVDVEQEKNALLAVDREWSMSTTDTDKFMSYVASDARMYPTGMPVVTGADAIRKTMTEISSAPGFALRWTPVSAEVAASGELGRTMGSYEMTMGGATEKGKYLTVWKKQADGSWKVIDDAFNADAGPAPAAHVMVNSRDVKWGDVPPVLPSGAKLAVISGDPGKSGPFAIRLQMPAGYRIAAHWHPTDENVTVLSGTFALGMGDAFDQTKVMDLPAGSYAVMPAEMRHFATAKTAATVQVNGMGPFVVNYVNPADDPSKQQK